MPNRLIDENSPYLLQHAENPVDWYPWDENVFVLARKEDKPVFLSIGYAACHWCHVMAHESFEDPDIAEIMNEHFINIKVDREEKPDIDHIYMSAVVSMTGQGGWPLSVFLTPDGEPFFGGTYFPPVRRYNMPSFREVLLSVQKVWENERDKIIESSQKIAKHINQASALYKQGYSLQTEDLEKAALRLAQSYDWKNGGWGRAPKFPQPMSIEFLINRAASGDKLAYDIASHALKSMAKGGMYDIIGGGFARYSTDDIWLIPHFEKMLYDNALLAKVYLHGYLVTGNQIFKRICEETLNFIMRDMTHPDGGFYSSLDADSEGGEGKYYVWTPNEIQEALPHKLDADLIIDAYNITDRGNFEGANVLQVTDDLDQLTNKFDLPRDAIVNKISDLNKRLLSARYKREQPGVDDKVLLSWNSYVMVVFAEAGRYLGNNRYLDMAIRNAQFLITELYSNGRLHRAWRDGRSSHTAYLEDYAGLILGLLSLYQSDPSPNWFELAFKLAEEMIVHFSDPHFGFFDTRDDHEPLLFRPKDLQDNATPSGNSLAVHALLQLAAYSGRGDWRQMAETSLLYMAEQAIKYPSAYAKWLCAFDLATASISEVAIIGNSNDPLTHSFLDLLWSEYRPHMILAQSNLPVDQNAPPLLENRYLLNDLPTAYVCRNHICKSPVNTPEKLRDLLKK
jgi:uncharacterized protein YyaL (SSP411 family)